MKKQKIVIVAAAVVLLNVLTAASAVIAYESFETYSDGTQLGDGSGTGGTGWATQWGSNAGGTSGADIYAQNGSDYGSSNKVAIIAETLTDSSWLTRSFTAFTTPMGSMGAGDTFYFAFTGQLLNSGNRESGFRIVSGTSGTTLLTVGLNNGGSTWRLQDADGEVGNSGISVTTLERIVVQIQLNADSGKDVVTFWVNPSETGGTSDYYKSYTSDTDFDAATGIRIGTNAGSSYGDAAEYMMDDIVLATTLEEAVNTVPEPATITLFSVAGIGMFIARRLMNRRY